MLLERWRRGFYLYLICYRVRPVLAVHTAEFINGVIAIRDVEVRESSYYLGGTFQA